LNKQLSESESESGWDYFQSSSLSNFILNVSGINLQVIKG